MANVLIIDDDELMCEMLSDAVREIGGHVAVYTHTLENGIRMAAEGRYDVVFLDVRMPDGNGIDILPKIKHSASRPEVIIITGTGDPDGAELAIKNGAWDYIEKPSSIGAMTLPLVRALEYRRERQRARAPVILKRDGIIGKSRAMELALDGLAQAAASDAGVLITGETGTGKELFARAVHDNSRRADGLFLVVDCAALPATLVESVLFGHEKGAFTGAEKAQTGMIKQADRGTLFLDEVGELPVDIQRAFLRVLQEHRFRPIGSKYEERSDFRLVAATNRDLVSMVEEGRFRNDLHYRLQGLVINIPPLRVRREDIRDLVLFHMARLCKIYEVEMKGFSPDFFEVLETYDWPGNVRELVNTLERILAVAKYEPTLFPKHLPDDVRIHWKRLSVSRNHHRPESGKKREEPPPEERPAPEQSFREISEDLPSLKAYREIMDKRYLHELLNRTGGDIAKACAVSGLSRSRLYGLIKSYNLSIPKK